MKSVTVTHICMCVRTYKVLSHPFSHFDLRRTHEMLLTSLVFIPCITFPECKNQGKMHVLKIIVVGLISSIICEFENFSSLLTIIFNLVVNMIYACRMSNKPSSSQCWKPLLSGSCCLNQEETVNPQKSGDWKCVCCRDQSKPPLLRAAETHKSGRHFFKKQITSNLSIIHYRCFFFFILSRLDTN